MWNTRRRRRIQEGLVYLVFWVCGILSIFVTIGTVLVLFVESIGFFREVPLTKFLTDTQWTPLFAEQHFGILPLVCGTFLTSFIAMSIAVPLGLLIAIYLSEYASERLRRILKPSLEVLAGIPTVVYGYFALLFVTPLLQRFIPNLMSLNALSPGIVMGFMILPMTASLSEDALYAVPQSLREGAYALGSTKLQVSLRVVVPSAFSGITAAFILSLSRAIGETMIVAIAAGQQPVLTLNPLVAIETMTAYIVQISLGDVPHGTLAYKTIFAVGMSMFLITLVLNLISIWLRERYRRAYA